MVSSSLDKSIKKALAKDQSSGSPNESGSAVNVNNSIHNNLNLNSSSSGVNYTNDSALPSDDTIQLLFPKCRPRSDYHHGQLTSQDTLTTDLISIDRSSLNPSQSKLPSNTVIHQQQLPHNSNNITQQVSNNNNNNLINLNINNNNNNNNSSSNNNCKQMKLQSSLLSSSPNKNIKKQHHPYINSEQTKLSKHNKNNDNNNSGNIKYEHNDENNYVETNPFRIGSGSNRYFYAQQNQQTDSILFNNKNKNSAIEAASSSSHSMMHHYQYTSSTTAPSTGGYYPSLERHNYFLEPDEIEHNPYMVDMVQSTTQPSSSSTTIPNTIPSSILKTTPPDTPPALQPCSTPVDSSPLGSSRNLWDLSPIKSTTPTRIKTQSPSPTIYSRPHRGSYKKLLASPPIEEDLETGHYYYNNKRPYYQPPQTDSDSANEPATLNDVHETEKVKSKSPYLSKSKIKHSETNDVVYAEVRNDRCKDEQRNSNNKIVKSKSGSGIMEYDGSPRRFGMASNDDIDYYTSKSCYNKYGGQLSSSPAPTSNGSLINYSSSSPPRPGFPQRIISHSASPKGASSIQIPKSYSFDDHLQSPSFSRQQIQQQNITATSTLIPTTFIKNSLSAYELLNTQEKPQQATIVEEDPEIIVDLQDDDKLEASSGNMIMVVPEASMETSSNINNSNTITHTSNSVGCIVDNPVDDKDEPQMNSEIPSIINNIANNTFDKASPTENLPTSTFDSFNYLYEFSETRKVLEEFFKCPDDKIKEFEKFSDFNESDDSLDIQYDYRGQIEKEMESLYSGNKQAMFVSPTIKQQLEDDSQQVDEDIDDDNRDDREDDKEEEAYVKAKQTGLIQQQQKNHHHSNEFMSDQKSYDHYLDTASRSSIGDDTVDQENDFGNLSITRKHLRKMTTNNNENINNSNISTNQNDNNSSSYQRRQSKNFNYSPDTTDYDSESSMRFISSEYPIPTVNASSATVEISGGPIINNYTPRYCTSMPVLEDGLSSGHTSDNENNNNNNTNNDTNNNNNEHIEIENSNENSTNNNNNIINSINGNTNTVSSSNDLNSYLNKHNTSTVASSINTIQKQYQENLVQTHANNNIFYNGNAIHKNTNSNSGSSTASLNGSKTPANIISNSHLLNNGDIHDTKVRSAQSPPNFHPYYAMRYDNVPKDSMRYDKSSTKETLRNENVSKEMINRYENKDPMMISSHSSLMSNNKIFKNRDPDLESLYTINTIQLTPPPPAPVAHRQIINDAQFAPSQTQQQQQSKQESDIQAALKDIRTSLQRSKMINATNSPPSLYNSNNVTNMVNNNSYYDRTPVISEKNESPAMSLSPVWIPRSREKTAHSPNETGSLLSKHNKNSDDEEEEEIDTDLETDRLLGHQMLDDGFYDDKNWSERKHQPSQQQKSHRPLIGSNLTSKISPKINHNSSLALQKSNASSLLRHGLNTLLPTSTSSDCCVNNNNNNNNNSPSSLAPTTSQHQSTSHSLKTSPATLNTNNMINLINSKSIASPDRICDDPRKLDDLQREDIQQNKNNNSTNITETNDLCNLDSELVDSPGGSSSDKSKTKDMTSNGDKKKKNKNKEVLIEGVLFRARYLGSTQLVCEGQPTKSTRMMQAEEAVSRIKALAPDGENQPSTEVDLFISTEKIMVLNTDLKEIMMDHALRTISYIADIGDLVVLMARRRFVPQDHEANSDSGTGTGGSGNVSGGSGGPTPPTSGKINRTPKMICHVFESEEAQFIAQSIGQAFQVAYMEFLKANGIEDHSFMKEMDYQEVLNSQEIFGDELEIFAKKELQKEVVVPKAKGEILGVVIVESGWGSMLPTVVIANLASNGAAARCGQLNIGDQIIAINGLSLVGLPLSQCQQYIKNTKNQTVVKFTVVPCAPVVEVKIKRPNTKYQLGFSVQNGVICSLLRGGIAERGGVRVGHRIIEINNQSVVAVPHEKIVNLLATSVGEILMKTMPTSMFRLLTGQENPIYI